MSAVAFIPVRGGSKSIPLKNIRLLKGRPLVYWTAKAANDAACIDRVVIATDSDAIRDAVRKFHLPKVELYNRDAENAQDTSSTESVMLEYLDKDRSLRPEDIFFLIQATSPLLKSVHIQEMFRQMMSENADSALSCVRDKRFYWTPDGVPINYDHNKRPRRQEFDGMLMENGACYISTVGNIQRDRNRLSGKIAVYEMPGYTATEIDEPDDFLIIEKLMNKYSGEKQIIKTEIKLFLTDCDGVLTDGGMYYTSEGESQKKFNTKDGMAFQLLRQAGIKTGIITGENSEIVRRRAEKIKADECYLGVKDKLSVLKAICEKYKIGLRNVAYIGDDVNDKEILWSVGVAACPQDAMACIKDIDKIRVMSRCGGDGCVREFAEELLRQY